MKISLIIPTLNAGKQIDRLLQALSNQTVAVDEIIVIDSQSDDDTEMICRKHKKVTFIPIKRSQFDHGGTRDYAFRQSNGEVVLFLTQDALPADDRYVEQIISPFQDESVAMVSGRQIAKDNATRIEKLTRHFNYPATSNIRTLKDIPVLGIKTFFASNVCSAYRRPAYIQTGGFDHPILTDEDLLIAARFIYGGYTLVYAAEAKVIHSHNFSLKQQFSRNFDIAVFMKMNSSFFQNISATKEGIQMVKYVLGELIKEKQFLQAGYYIAECGAKFLGYKLGSNYRKLSRKWIEICTGNKNYWNLIFSGYRSGS
ncbi:MAG: glycosyltransferase [Candidatus Symbiothrix sp.]|jgi:rhamnosyltransferase|nr:glycosyltransferase [Candidatus Symbiothrix sp.]